MMPNLNEISHILTGDNDKPAKQAPTTGMATQGQPINQAHGLSQLSDAAEKIEVKVDKPPTTQAANEPQPPHPAPLSQETLIDAAQQLQFQQPSQPDIPPPIIPDSQGSQPINIGEDGKPLLPPTLTLANDPNMLTQLNILGSAMALDPLSIGNIYPYLTGIGSPEEEIQTGGNRSKGKKQTRRGPMDEMRQLIRILVKIFPHSLQLIGNTEEAGGGNRISEEQIKSYLDRVMGEAPRPVWGVPTGWYGYLAELFSWATGKVVTGEEAKRVARREPGRSWEALVAELHNIGVHPSSWPLPLTLAGIHEAEKNPVPLPVPAMPSRRGAGGQDDGTGTHTTTTKRRAHLSEKDFNKLEEPELWKAIVDALTVAQHKTGTGADQTSVTASRTLAKMKIDEMIANSIGSFNTYLPMLSGLDGNPSIFSNVLQALPLDDGGATAAALAAMTGGTMENLAAAGGIPALASTAAAAVAAAATAEGLHTTMAHTMNAGGGDDEGPVAKKMKKDSDGSGEGDGDEHAAAKNGGGVGGQLGSLPMQPPPLNVNFSNALQAAAGMQYPMMIPPGFSIGSLGGMPNGGSGGGHGGNNGNGGGGEQGAE